MGKNIHLNMICCITITFFNFSNCELKAILQEIKNLTNNIRTAMDLNNKLRVKQLTLSFNPIEYPKKNETKLIEIKQLWSIYYKCLEIQAKAYGHLKSSPMVAVMIYLGSSLKLECIMCQSPEDALENLIWYYSGTFNVTRADTLDERTNVLISPYDGTLEIYNVVTEDAGLYYCAVHQQRSPYYFVHIANEKEPFTTVWPETAPKAKHAQEEKEIPHSVVRVKTEWSGWTSCSTCGIVGKQKRTGICSVYTKQDRDIKNIGEDPLSTLYSFKDGIPCRSKLLPKFIRKVRDIKKRSSEMMIGYCKVPCEKVKLFVEVDEKGRPIRTFNNSNGEFSTFQDLPPATPQVQRISIYIQYHKKAKLTCPGRLNTDKPIQWLSGFHPIHEQTIIKETKGRISINEHDQIVFKKVLLKDTKIYSCWQGSQLAGTIHMTVHEPVKSNVNKFLAILVVTVIFGAIVKLSYEAHKKKIELKARQ